VGSALFKLIAPYLPVIIPILLIFLLLWFIMGAIFSSTPQGELFTGPQHTVQDEKLVAFYKDITEKNNKRDIWLVSGEKETGTWYEEINTDLMGYEGKILTNEDIRRLGLNQASGAQHYYEIEQLSKKEPIPWPLQDYYGRDAEYFETFGQIHSGSVWHMLTFSKEHTTDEFKELNAAEFRPYLYYKKSYIKTTYTPNNPEEESSTSVTPLYLIVEGNGLQDHRVYHYEWKTETSESKSGTTTTSWEELVGQTSLRILNPWQRLDDWVQEKYNIPENKKDQIQVARISVWEAGIGYTKASERLEWLLSGNLDSRYLSQSFVPDDIMSAFYTAEDLFGIPAWFLAALAMKESSLNPDAENSKSGAIGLFQILNGKFAVDKLMVDYSDKLPPQLVKLYNDTPEKDDNFYRQVLKDPYVNTLAGSLVFIGKCTNNNIKIADIDWDGDWQQQILPVLVNYGGYAEVPKKLWSKYGIKNEEQASSKENLQKWCYDEYASAIFKNTERFKIENRPPIDGVVLVSTDSGGNISSPYGPRINPVTKERSFHYGVDLAFPSGTPIRSTAPGKVVFAGYNNNVAGYEVKIDHGTYITRYLHCLANSITIRAGDFVNAGTKIAEVGSTGRSTGPHLHFEVLIMNSAGKYQNIDPVGFLAKGR